MVRVLQLPRSFTFILYFMSLYPCPNTKYQYLAGMYGTDGKFAICSQKSKMCTPAGFCCLSSCFLCHAFEKGSVNPVDTMSVAEVQL